MIQDYSFPTNIHFGPGSVRDLADYLTHCSLSRPLIITDRQVSGLDFFKVVVRSLESKKIGAETFDRIHANPIESDVLIGTRHFIDTGRDSVIGFGGGAAMDVARAITLKAYHTRELFDYDELENGTQFITEPMPHFITIPTTSGTGSEVGRAAIISEDLTKRKRILFHPRLMALKVFADPELTYELPAHITAATGMDALTHNVEAFVSKGWHPLCEGIALEGIRLITKSIEKAVNHPDPTVRSNMMIGSLMGAVAFQKGLGVVHSLSHPLSTLLDMHHGLANAINLPYGVQFNYDSKEVAFQRIGEAMRLKRTKKENLVQKLFDLNSSLGLPIKLNTQGVSKDHIEPLVALALKDFCLPANPRSVTAQDLTGLYSAALG